MGSAEVPGWNHFPGDFEWSFSIINFETWGMRTDHPEAPRYLQPGSKQHHDAIKDAEPMIDGDDFLGGLHHGLKRD